MSPGSPMVMDTGLTSVEVLENLDLDIHMFKSTNSNHGDEMKAALSKIADTKALIIDLRKCRGGDGSMVHYYKILSLVEKKMKILYLLLNYTSGHRMK